MTGLTSPARTAVLRTEGPRASGRPFPAKLSARTALITPEMASGAGPDLERMLPANPGENGKERAVRPLRPEGRVHSPRLALRSPPALPSFIRLRRACTSLPFLFCFTTSLRPVSLTLLHFGKSDPTPSWAENRRAWGTCPARPGHSVNGVKGMWHIKCQGHSSDAAAVCCA